MRELSSMRGANECGVGVTLLPALVKRCTPSSAGTEAAPLLPPPCSVGSAGIDAVVRSSIPGGKHEHAVGSAGWSSR